MNFLLDTNGVSEWMKPRPNAGLIRWLEQVDEDRVYLSVVTLAEIRYGVDRLAEGAKRRGIEQWLQRDLQLRFEGRIVAIDSAIADACGAIVARRETLGHPIGVMDAFIAATAETHELTLVTRNTKDFMHVAGSIENPWSS